MQPSNISHNDASFSGILQTYIDAISRSPRSAKQLVGQQVAQLHEGPIAIVAIDGADDIHLLISADNKEDSRLSNLDLRGLKVTNHKLAVAGHPVRNYLDIACTTGEIPSFRRPFLKFAEDVLFEISKLPANPVDAAYHTAMKWRRFWALDASEFTLEWMHGIFGELLFVKELIERIGSQTIQYWVGPYGRDHDFQFNDDLAVEVKASVEKPFKINCNIRQLDPEIFKSLFVVCYQITNSNVGMSLPDLVAQIESRIRKDENILDVFYEKLAAAGYRRDCESAYRERQLEFSAPVVFQVDESFPKIIEKSFKVTPDHRIGNIRYSLKMTGLEELPLSTIIQKLAKRLS